MSDNPDQRSLDFNTIEATPEQREIFRRLALQWTLEEEEEDFKRLPGETLEEFWAARDAHLRTIEAFGVTEKPPSVAWEMMNGQRPPPRQPRQLPLPFDNLTPS